jgi:nucleotide-binding universal stress UspA family protein
MGKIRTIMHPTDFSPASRAALTRALEMAKANRAQLVIVHVMAPVVAMMGDGYVSPKVYDEMDAAARAHARKQLVGVLARAKRAGVRSSTLLLEGLPHEQIRRAARARRADVIVMGTHGRTGLARFFMGSVAERVIGTAPCPVLTVRGK